LAVALDGLFNIFKYVKPALVVAISLFFTIVSISELCDYQQNYFMDRRIVNYVAKELDKEGKNTVVGAKDTYIELNVLYAEHIKSIASSDWALTGALREHLKDRKLPMVQFNPENIDDVNLISLYDMTQ
jgi:predicted small integral membrane protein